jgi:hypothetical protein
MMKNDSKTIKLFLPGLIIFVILLTLRIGGLISWGWMWITFPLWAPFAFIICFVIAAIISLLIYNILVIHILNNLLDITWRIYYKAADMMEKLFEKF